MTTYTNSSTGGVKINGKSPTNDPVVVITSINQLDATTFKVRFRSQRVPPVSFWVYLQGKLLSPPSPIVTTSGIGSVILTVAANTSPFFEILDDANQRPHDAYPGSFTLNWTNIAGAESYDVQENESGTWTTLRTVPEDGTNNHLFLTDWLTDSTTYDFRVVPVDASGETGTPISWDGEMIRHPDIPSVNYAYNATTKHMTIAAN